MLAEGIRKEATPAKVQHNNTQSNPGKISDLPRYHNFTKHAKNGELYNREASKGFQVLQE